MVPNHSKITDAPALSRRQQRWVLVGLIVQPVVAALFGFVTWPIFDATRIPPSGTSSRGPIGMAVWFALNMSWVSLFVAFCAALPLLYWLRGRGPITFRKTLVSGALLGNLPNAFVLMLITARAVVGPLVGAPESHPPVVHAPSDPFGLMFLAPLINLIRVTVYSSAIGATCAAVFWRIVGRHLQAD
jgi:hypothetical protein